MNGTRKLTCVKNKRRIQAKRCLADKKLPKFFAEKLPSWNIDEEEISWPMSIMEERPNRNQKRPLQESCTTKFKCCWMS